MQDSAFSQFLVVEYFCHYMKLLYNSWKMSKIQEHFNLLFWNKILRYLYQILYFKNPTSFHFKPNYLSALQLIIWFM